MYEKFHFYNRKGRPSAILSLVFVTILQQSPIFSERKTWVFRLLTYKNSHALKKN